MSLDSTYDQPYIEILMATYNGAKYLVEQIESIRCQDYKNWKLIISDDGSNDDTLEIINRYTEIDSRIKLVNIPHEGNNASANFLGLIQISRANYVMYADQDDIWLFDKIDSEIAAMQMLEKKYDSETPLLVFTDSVIVDESLNIINVSCSSVKPYRSSSITFEQLLFNNIGQGCTMLLNKALVEMVRNNPMDSSFKMHDYWTMTLASYFGGVYYLEQPTVLYRQHSNNVYGIRYLNQSAKNGLSHILADPSIVKGWLKRLSDSEKDFQLRAKALARCDNRNQPAHKVDCLAKLCSFDSLSLIEKLKLIYTRKLIRNQRNRYSRYCQLLGLMSYK